MVNHPNLLRFYGTVVELPTFCIVTGYSYYCQLTPQLVLTFNLHIKLLPVCTCQANPLFIAEYVEQGALFDILHQNEFNSDRNLMWAKQIAAGTYIHVTKLLTVVLKVTFPCLIGMKYLHFDVLGREVIHRDLKSTNGIAPFSVF